MTSYSRATPREPGCEIHVSLGLKADGGIPVIAPDAVGCVTVGPLGFLSLLETQLGIPVSDVSFTTRLIQYLACVDRADHEDTFYHASYAADPFSVARTLLQWRDQWYLAGWDGTFRGKVSARLADMAALEELAAAEVEPGLGQRIQTVIGLLANNPVAVASISLCDQLTDFPKLWQLFIEAVGVPLTEAESTSSQGREGSDLFKLQQHLLRNTGEKIDLSGDDTVLVLRAGSAQDSTALIARLSQQWLTDLPDQTLAILAEARGDLLDEAFEAAFSPRLGFTALSPWRPIFQVLPLACELLWEPLNLTALFQFLSHSVGPIPARQRERLAATIADVPGIGSASWEKAIERCLEGEKEKAKERYRENIRYWLESPRYSPQTGVDCATLSERAERLAKWLAGAMETSKDATNRSLYSIARNQTLEVIEAVDRLKAHGRDPLNRDYVLRLIEDVRGTGAPVADRQSEVVPGQNRALRSEHAGAFYAPIDNVIWWDCQAADHIQRWPWSKNERAALSANGVDLQSEAEQLDWLGKAWLRPVLNAREKCVFVLHNDVERHHPLWEQIASLTNSLRIEPIADSECVVRLGIPQATLEVRHLPRKTRWWQLPEDIELPQRQAESYTSLDAYINSPYQWVLNYAAKIRPGSLVSVRDGNLLKGTLAHRLYEEFLNTHPDIPAINVEAIPDWVDEHAGILLQQEGALLLGSGRQAECEQFIVMTQQSLSALVTHLQQAKTERVQVELWQEGQFVGGNLNGSIDLIATRADGQEAVVDVKLGGRTYRRTSLRESNYLQLATYAQLRSGAGQANSPALSYFIAADAQMLSLDHDFFPQAERIVPDNEENTLQYWHRFEHTWAWRHEQFDRGLIEVTVSDTEPTDQSLPGEDGLAMPEASDSFSDYGVVTGWKANA